MSYLGLFQRFWRAKRRRKSIENEKRAKEPETERERQGQRDRERGCVFAVFCYKKSGPNMVQ